MRPTAPSDRHMKHLEHVKTQDYSLKILQSRIEALESYIGSYAANENPDLKWHRYEKEVLENAYSMICDGRPLEIVLETNYCTFRG